MKNKSFCRCVLFVLGCLFFGCQDKGTTTITTDDELIVSVVNGKLVSSLKSEKLINFSQRALEASAEAVPILKSGKVINSHIELSGEYYYLISQFKDNKTGQISNTAIELKKRQTPEQGAGLRLGADGPVTNSEGGGIPQYKHICTGNPCSNCAFTKNSRGEINGCRCAGPTDHGRHCDHTVTTG